MKKISQSVFALVALLTLATACKKESHEKPAEQSNTPKTTIPAAYVGKWMGGYFDMSKFSSYDGTRQANATNMVAYTFNADGTAEQFIYYDYEDGSDKQVLTYRKGTATYDAATETLKFCPGEGRYRIFENGHKTAEALTANGLYPAYAPAYRNCTFEQDGGVTYFVGTSDQGDLVGFAKTAW